MLAFLLEASLLTLSGVIIPGPVSALTISQGAKSPHIGAIIAIGHGIVEIPLMILILFGFGQFLKIAFIKTIISFLGGLFLLKLAYALLKGINESKEVSNNDLTSPLKAGIVLTLANPAYLTWLATIGSILVLRSYKFGLSGFLLYITLHWSVDIA